MIIHKGSLHPFIYGGGSWGLQKLVKEQDVKFFSKMRGLAKGGDSVKRG